MIQISKINESRLDRLLREVVVRGEELRALQDEKQSVMDEFTNECERCRNGQISKQVLIESAKRVTSELASLDLKIRRNVRESQNHNKKVHVYLELHIPENYLATNDGLKKRRTRKLKARKTQKLRRAVKKQKSARARVRRSKRSRRAAKKR